MRRTDIDGLFGCLYGLRDRALDEASRLPSDAFRSPATVAYRDLLLHRAGPSMGDVGFLDYVDSIGPRPGTPGG